ncbi:MAG: MerR family transcriptional regulator [Parvibaculaceae bacterium]|jgi:DNA-binding transcriptional MerR regulator|nr:MerR family transcriptional regulator [Parvibaculaceae bacterium]|tara:strand:+ start:786 stop:1223 length:438 start_codon:yes stop_codon:yes gene_type:complete
MSDESTYPIDRVAQLTGHSKQMLDYLCRIEVIIPAVAGRRGRGRMRRFHFADIVLLRTIKLLLDQGVSVKKIKKSLKNIREKFSEFTPNQLPSGFIFTDGKEVYLKTAEDALAEISKSGQLSFCFIIDMQTLKKDVDERLKAISA